ncbi:MAG: translation initiation factor IF-2 subunit alpha [Candidatus Heimdallarchaeota archaeon]
MVRKEMPEEGEMVLATCTNVTNHGAYFTLDEFPNLEKGSAFVHISEISQRWVRNIRDYVREGTKVVARVTRADPAKGHVDMSIRRVGDSARRQKIQTWKNNQKAANILRLAAENLGKDLDAAYNEVGGPLEERYGSIYAGLEKIIEDDKKILINAGIAEEWIEVVTRLTHSSIEIPFVTISGILDLSLSASNGIQIIKKALEAAEKVDGPDVAKIEITAVGAPHYRVIVEAKDYKSAEKALEKAVELVITNIEKAKGTGKFERAK